MESEGVNEIRRATPSMKQIIRDALNDQQLDQLDMTNKRDKSETRKLHEIEIKALVKRPLALVDKNSSAPLKSSIQRIGENIRAGT